jgi:sulfoxide reductase heme-binding subunit YedZ
MKNFVLKNKYWLITHFPAVIIILLLITQQVKIKSLHTYSGYIATSFLILVLILKPLRIVYPNFFLVRWGLGKHKREIGVASFTYAAIHAFLFYLKKDSISKFLSYLIHPAIFPGFTIALPILFVLAITSNNYSVKKLGYEKWKRIHKKVYIAQYAVFIHMIMVKEVVWAMVYFVPLFIMQYLKRRKEAISK